MSVHSNESNVIERKQVTAIGGKFTPPSQCASSGVLVTPPMLPSTNAYLYTERFILHLNVRRKYSL